MSAPGMTAIIQAFDPKLVNMYVTGSGSIIDPFIIHGL